MEKIKSRWRKNYLEGDNNDSSQKSDANESNNINSSNNSNQSSKHSTPPTYEPLTENLYLDKRKNEHSRSRKDARSMVCDCILTKEERARGIMGCLDDCLNRMLMIECGPKCTLGEHCLNKRFQKCQSAKVEVFKTKKKGWGLRAITELPSNSFIMEYVGEVVRSKEFRRRVKKYTKQKIKHHYFMALRSDEIIDATVKGNLTRFINHSCEPNCETQKWTVNGDLRIGFFTIRNLQPGDEITFDYQFQRYGKKAQKCYCEAPSCRGHIGANEQTFSLNGNLSPQLNENKAHKKSFKHGLLVDVTLEDKINALAEDAAQGLKTKDQVIALASLSIKAEEVGDRRKLLDIIKTTKSEFSLRLFVDYHGLEILCLWMRDPQADCDFKATIIEILDRLPIPNKTKVLESNVYRMIERWAIDEPRTILPQNPAENNVNNVSTINNGNSDYNIKSEKHEDDKDDCGESKSQELIKLSEPNNKINENSTNRTSQPSTPIKESSNALLPSQNINSPSIRALASKLLKKFQALSPGFKIPRLSRLQRMEIEKKMEEDVVDDQASHDRLRCEQNNPFANRNYFKSTPSNGLVSASTIKTNHILPNKRRFDSFATNNIDLTPAPKISKEEHRQQFEMHVRLKDYYDTIEKHYGPATVEQIKLRQRAYNNLNGLPLPYQVPGHNIPPYMNTNHHLGPSISPALLVPQPPQPSPISAKVQPQPPPSVASAAATVASVVTNNSVTPHLIYPGISLDTADNRYQQPLVVPPTLAVPAPAVVNNYHHLTAHLQSNDQQPNITSLAYQMNGGDYSSDSYHELYSHHKESEPESIVTTISAVNDTELEATKPEPTLLPTLIVLANNSIEPAHAIDDELAFSICDYDEYYSNRDKPLRVDDVNDDLHPFPGSYYTTPSGETWFATVTLDRKTQQPRTVILNLQIRSEAEKSPTTSPNKLPTATQDSYNTIDEPVISNITSTASTPPLTTVTTLPAITTINNTTLTASAATTIDTQELAISAQFPVQAPSSTDTITESPTANNFSGEKMPGKIKKKMFEHGVSKFIKDALSEYYKPDCQQARITSKEDFVFLARKLTLAVLEKELNRKGGCERLECNKQVKRKVEDFVRIYMAKFGKLYTRNNKA